MADTAAASAAAPIHVLLVDDAVASSETMAAFLEQEGDFSVELAATGTEGLRRLHDEDTDYDCVVSDYQIPGMDGLELLAAVREEWPKLPFLLLTDYGNESIASEAISAGVTDYVKKRSSTKRRDVLMNRITNAVTKHRAEKTLERERVLTRQALDSINDIFYIANADGTLRYWNDQLSSLTGYDNDEIADMRIHDFLAGNANDGQSVPEPRLELPPEESCTIEATIQTAGGEQVPHECTVTPLADAVEKDGGVVGVARNLVERKEREEELRTLKERFELATEGANLGVWDWDMNTDDVEYNDNWATMLGHEPAEISSALDEWRRRVHPDDVETVQAALRDHIEGGTEYYDTELRMQTAGGDWKWIRDIGQVVERDADGTPVRAVGIHLDIDDKKRTEQALREKRDIFTQGPTVVFRWENDGSSTISYVSKNVEDVFGYSVADLESQPFRPLVHYEDVERVVSKTKTAMANGDDQVKHDPYRIITAEGEVRWVLDHTTLVWAGDDVSHRLGYLIDITERKERQQRLERKNEQLDEFASVVSHDLRNPMNVAEGRVELAQMACDCGNDHLSDAGDAFDRMHALVDDLLTLARQGDTITEPGPVDLSALVSACWCSVDTADAELEADTPTVVLADRSRLKQLIENLFRNAVEHGGRDVTVTVGELDDRNGFYIADDGPGIPDDKREDVFEHGYSTADSGTGFGLAIVREIAEAHEWSLNVTESDGGGARIELANMSIDNTTEGNG
ncbi:receiver/sensor box histidine kinase (plasmid) [Natronomonas pharaonis DSM 2160]|uniref:histidine kinase n=1 Tax=Natronomonas pharaonis (strain ATCC 35678 / DSM 2160 / CIP 103997 / JCM 8858 / NBRC 14720 / NCIMB 2260 / Gabara) TaxID=348780 RepID=Q3ILY8_NATPD|nr:PAS domain-containing protein [Natronomonas pharaonis]CAI50881.1 receiver/sensor box histidine kinase [Natronomonas pharaonis DSM 2160]